MTYLHALSELTALAAGAGLHVWMKWSNWRETDMGRAAGGSFRAFRAVPEHRMASGVISDVVLFSAILGRSTLGMAMEGADVVAEAAMLVVAGYIVDSGAKNLLPMFQRAVTDKAKRWIDGWGKS